jgi:Ketopantoate hydroxymethyltransferase
MRPAAATSSHSAAIRRFRVRRRRHRQSCPEPGCRRLRAPASTDLQILVFHDLLGIYDGQIARFVKRYGNLRQAMIDGVAAFCADVRARRYPEPRHRYAMAPSEVERLHASLGDLLLGAERPL